MKLGWRWGVRVLRRRPGGAAALTARGPVIVEINARIGGDLIPYLGRLATGVDPAHVAVDLARACPRRGRPGGRGCPWCRWEARVVVAVPAAIIVAVLVLGHPACPVQRDNCFSIPLAAARRAAFPQ
jgi:hypothetical protein